MLVRSDEDAVSRYDSNAELKFLFPVDTWIKSKLLQLFLSVLTRSFNSDYGRSPAKVALPGFMAVFSYESIVVSSPTVALTLLKLAIWARYSCLLFLSM